MKKEIKQHLICSRAESLRETEAEEKYVPRSQVRLLRNDAAAAASAGPESQLMCETSALDLL